MTIVTLWWITLALGLVVAVVATALLHILYRMVVRIDEGVLAVWEMGKQVARNTATTWMLGQTGPLAAEIKEEALIHDAFLTEALK
ncbi:MAG: hypothetical protein Q8Q52_04185 [Acidimicrobiia bacterium]|nr:hypothetical protein [Acidimicrobiia bacterium]